MRFVFYTNSVSAHQLPMAREIVKRIGAENFLYVSVEALQGGAQEVAAEDPWIVRLTEPAARARATDWLENADVMMTNFREMDLLERRSARGLKTFYQGERWFKPIPFPFHLLLPGWLRMWVPRYRRMAKRFVRLAKADPNFRVLPIGPWAKKDLLSIGVPEEKMIPWAYFVSPTHPSNSLPPTPTHPSNSLRVLWVGRPLWWKRVDTIRKAVAHVPGATLDVLSGLSLAQVREEMRRHDVYVLASNALEGWGAVVNEALLEGMAVIGTYEAGASAALLPEENLFHAGDWRRLAEILRARSYRHIELPAAYLPSSAAEKVLGKGER